MNITYPLSIFYDASCPLCLREMTALKKHDSLNRLILIDCSGDNFLHASAKAKGISRAAMMRLIHARDGAGNWLIGVEVFEAAYRAAGITGVEKMFGNAWMRPFWNRIYPAIANNRMMLSKLGVTFLFGVLVEHAAKRAATKAAANALKRSSLCAEGHCEIRKD